MDTQLFRICNRCAEASEIGYQVDLKSASRRGTARLPQIIGFGSDGTAAADRRPPGAEAIAAGCLKS